jgi:hypothetical protein
LHIDSPWNLSTSASIVRGPLTAKWTGIKAIGMVLGLAKG